MIRFDIPDMTCGACARRIARSLAQAGLPADLQVEVDVAARQVRLPLGAQAAAAQAVKAAIERAGYTATPTSAEPAATAPRTRAGACCCAARRASALDEGQSSPAPSAGCCG